MRYILQVYKLTSVTFVSIVGHWVKFSTAREFLIPQVGGPLAHFEIVKFRDPWMERKVWQYHFATLRVLYFVMVSSPCRCYSLDTTMIVVHPGSSTQRDKRPHLSSWSIDEHFISSRRSTDLVEMSITHRSWPESFCRFKRKKKKKK